MAQNPAESALLTPPQPNRIKQRLPEASPFTAFLKHLPDLTPPKSSAYNSYSSFAFTVQSPAPARLQSHQTPAKARAGDQDHDTAPFANILALADLKATPVKPEEAEGFGYRGSGAETPYGLRSPIPLFHESPRRPGRVSGGSSTPGKLPGSSGEMGRELREQLAAGGGRGPSGSSNGGAGGSLGGLGSPHLISSAFAALLEGHSRSSAGGALSMLGGSGGAGSARSFSPLFSPSKQSPNGGSSLGPPDRRGSGDSPAVASERGAGANGGDGVKSEPQGAGAGAAHERVGGGAVESQQRLQQQQQGAGGSSGGGAAAAAAAGASSTLAPPPFFSPSPLSGVPVSLERGGSYRTGSSSGMLGAGNEAEGRGEGDTGSESEEDQGMVGADDAEDEDYVLDEDDPGSDGETAGGRRGGGGGRSSLRPPAESPRVVRHRVPGSPGPRYMRGGGLYDGVPGAPQRRVGARAGSSADSLAAHGGYATDDDAEPTPLVHAMLPQSPMCVPLNLDTFLPIPKLRHSESRAEGEAEGDGGSPTGRQAMVPPLPFDSPAVKAATNAAITAALEAAVGPASSGGAGASARGTRAAERGRNMAARAAAAAAAGVGSAPLTRRMSNNSSGGKPFDARAAPQSFLPAQQADEVLLAKMISLSNKKCNCKKSKCLKLYCDCFAGGGFCGPQCSCAGCANRADNLDVVLGAREQIASRNPNAFKEKIEADPSLGGQHRRGCNCKKSHCMKKYCECFSAGVPCGEHCKCEGCHNTPDSFKRGGPGGRGRRAAQATTAAPAAAALAAAPPLPAQAAAAAAMRAGAFPILIPAGAAARGMAMPASAAARAGTAAAGSTRAMPTDAAAALALGGALQFLLPLHQQQQQQQQALAASGDASAAARLGSEGPPGDMAAAAAAAARQTTPSPPPPGSAALSPVANASGLGPAASSPQMLQIFSMLQPTGAAAGMKPPNMVTSNGQLYVPLMWPFNGGATPAAGQPTIPTLTPQPQPQQVDGNSAALGMVSGAPTPPHTQPSGAIPLAGEAAAPQQSQLASSTGPAAAAAGDAAVAAAGPGREGPAGAVAPALPSLQPSSSFGTLQGGVAAAHPAAQGSGTEPALPAQQEAAWPSQGEVPLLPAAEQQAQQEGGGASAGALCGIPQSPPGAGQPPGAGLLGVISPAAPIKTPLGAAASQRPRPPAAVSDMDLCLDSPRSGEGPSPAAAAAAAAKASGGSAGVTWLQAGAITANGRAAAAAAAAAAAQQDMYPSAGGEEELQEPGQGQGGRQQAAPPAGLTTRKRARVAEAQRASSSDGSGGSMLSQRGGPHLRPPPASPRATPTKRKPLRTITSALM